MSLLYLNGIKLRLRKKGKIGYRSSMSITTKRGDNGGTDLMFGKRTAKIGNRIEAIGSLDELNAALGLVRVEANASLGKSIDLLQGYLVGLMGELAVLSEDLEKYRSSGHPSITDDEVKLLENLASELEESGIVFDGWARPGSKGSRTGAQLDFARTVCRRAERRVLALSEELSNTNILLFLNRLSDLLWLYARHCEAVEQTDS
ncbi:MAG: ATP:cob(I)alamin adenosyltransferase [Roseibacillus sp.]|nr:ATP:cob(I)alamin adenosyltransferase [Roseibacillus sp.]